MNRHLNDRLRRLHADGLSVAQMAERTGLSTTQVTGRLGVMGLRRKLSGYVDELERILATEALTARECAARMHIQLTTARTYLSILIRQGRVIKLSDARYTRSSAPERAEGT